MMVRWIGAVMILGGCGGFGFSMAAEEKRRQRLLRDLQRALKLMQWELQYRLTPLPELCFLTGKQVGGPVGKVLRRLSAGLRDSVCPEVSSCLESVLQTMEDLPRPIRHLLRQLGASLGRYDLAGQLQGLEAVSEGCRTEWTRLEEGRVQRLRSYRTLGICAGAALAILLI